MKVLKKLKGGNIASLFVAILPFGVLLLLLFFLFKPFRELITGLFNIPNKILETLGFKKSESEKFVEDNLARTGSPFDINFHKEAPGGTLFPNRAKAEKLAEQIHYAIVGAWGFAIYKDGNSVLDALKQCTNQASVSFVSRVFSEKYHADMLAFLYNPGFLRTGLNSEALQKIISYANSLPKF